VPFGDPDNCAPEDFRFDICGSVKSDVPGNDYGVILKTIPGGRCAVVRHIGSTDAISETVRPLYAQWLPNSGEVLRDYPCFFHYIERMPQVAEHEQVTDIYLPLM
jgi:AraC family transcriptional regulator